MSTLSGSCHCGNIAFELDWPGDATAIAARRCGCTFFDCPHSGDVRIVEGEP